MEPVEGTAGLAATVPVAGGRVSRLGWETMGAGLWCVIDPGSGDHGVSRSWVVPEDVVLLETKGGPRRVPPRCGSASAAAAWLRESKKDYRPPSLSY
ncbi:hypothetical protein [Spongiactinospora sp. 9N601]|uniref:hypothetical protein n=1 Tax=Spongiactinospora sp. 9N601 TaxID=3375149 RepID=UPI0037AF12A4